MSGVPNSLCRSDESVGAMDRRSCLKRVGAVSFAGVLSGCMGGGGTTDLRSSTPTTTAASFTGKWGLPPCSENKDARVVIQDYNPEQGVGKVYNRTSTNLLVSIVNKAGYAAEDNQGNHDIYVPFGESESFRLGGQLASVVTMTESKYRRRDSVDWTYRHETQENEGCTLPEGQPPSQIQATPKEEDREEDRIKDNVRDSVDGGDTTEYERDNDTSTDDDGRSTTEERSSSLVGDIREARKDSTGIRVLFSVDAGANAPESVPYTLRVLTKSDESYLQSGTISLERNSTVSKEVLVEFSAFDEGAEYAVELILDSSFQDAVVVN